MFRPMWPSSGVKIIGRGNCYLLLLLMLLIYKFPRCTYAFLLVGCVLSCCVLCNRMLQYNTILWKTSHYCYLPCLRNIDLYFKVKSIFHVVKNPQCNSRHSQCLDLGERMGIFSSRDGTICSLWGHQVYRKGNELSFVINMIVLMKFVSRTRALLTWAVRTLSVMRKCFNFLNANTELYVRSLYNLLYVVSMGI
jgi:hypothetical protein